MNMKHFWPVAPGWMLISILLFVAACAPQVALPDEIDTLDPHQSCWIFQVHQNIVESLVTPNATLDRVIPELANGWDVSEDGLTYTFYLREGVRFHNGRPFTAEDVIFSFDRIMYPDFPIAYRTRSDLDMVESIEALDDYTVVFRLNSPYARFLTKLESLWILPNGAKVIPELAKGWDVSEDGLTYTFYLRKGGFHNGQPFTAEDVIFSLNCSMNPDFPVAYHTRSALDMVDTIEALDDYTVVFRLNSPDARFLAKLESLWILPHGAAVDFNQKLIGTGPFRFIEWIPGDTIRLERFDEYWEEDKPFLDQVMFPIRGGASFPNLEEGLKIALESRLDFISDVTPDEVARFEDDPDFTIYRAPSLESYHLGFNVTQPPFDDKRVRQAMGYLIDREVIAEVVMRGYAQPAQTAIPESHWAFNPAVVDAYIFDPERARDLLAEAGYANGFRATIKVRSDPVFVAMAELIAENARGVRVDFNIVPLEESAWWEEVVIDGDYEAEISAISGGIDPDDFFYPWHHSGESNNIWRFRTRELDGWLEEARYLPDQEARTEFYDWIQLYLIDQAPVIHIIYPESIMVSTANVEGFVMTGRRDMNLKTVLRLE